MHLRTALSAACLLALPHSILAQKICNATIINLKGTTQDAQDVTTPGMDITIQGNKIESIEAAQSSCGQDTNNIDATDMFCMPGLVESHAHVCFSDKAGDCVKSAPSVLTALLANGVTTVQDLGSNCKAVEQSKKQVRKLGVPPPRVHTTCEMFDGAGTIYVDEKTGEKSAPITLLTDPLKAESELQKVLARGAYRAKVHLGMDEPSFAALSKACKRRKMLIGGHVPTNMLAKRALELGMNYFEHMSGINTTEVIQKIGNEKMAVTCTLIQGPSPAALKLCGDLKDAGANILTGTDAPAGEGLCPDGATHKELGLLVKAGFTTVEALQAATTNAYNALGLGSEFGIEPGMTADMLLLKANPVDDISNMNSKNIAFVVMDGKVLDKKKLQKLRDIADVQNTLPFACGGDPKKASLQSRATCCDGH
ncbi:hypothetical protein G6O67_001879 [Ophiocordyceps sinensis]|uniref:Amidohydrolase-related domain-containing protein n=3 Tax=Ophiocordyceps sinensis TaxID=72228 RepID=A0A8H4PT66_9HYPO|nr:amidohydrolase [Ophiocordyceps sinensis CO18]KAF4509947.1 hypothetical protein G6O67_001879 [Ophiocordyceps sinensis]